MALPSFKEKIKKWAIFGRTCPFTQLSSFFPFSLMRFALLSSFFPTIVEYADLKFFHFASFACITVKAKYMARAQTCSEFISRWKMVVELGFPLSYPSLCIMTIKHSHWTNPILSLMNKAYRDWLSFCSWERPSLNDFYSLYSFFN